MAEHIWSVLCTKALIDSDTQMISLLEVVERVNIHVREDFERTLANLVPDEQPIIPHTFYLASWWVRTDYAVPETGAFRVRILLPDGNYADLTLLVDIALENTTGFRARIQVPGIPWAGIGLYWYVIEEQLAQDEWRVATRIPLELKFTDSPPQVAGPSQPERPAKKPKTKKKMARKKRAIAVDLQRKYIP